jgi:hypothetical protein
MLIAWLLVVSACVVEPTDNNFAPTDGIQKLWGFVLEAPGAAISIEAINSSNVWEVVATGVASTRVTHTGTSSGNYWELTVNVRTLPARFQVGGRVRLRAKAGSFTMRTRSNDQQRPRVANTALLELWNAYVTPTSSNSIITVWL